MKDVGGQRYISVVDIMVWWWSGSEMGKRPFTRLGGFESAEAARASGDEANGVGPTSLGVRRKRWRDALLEHYNQSTTNLALLIGLKHHCKLVVCRTCPSLPSTIFSCLHNQTHGLSHWLNLSTHGNMPQSLPSDLGSFRLMDGPTG